MNNYKNDTFWDELPQNFWTNFTNTKINSKEVPSFLKSDKQFISDWKFDVEANCYKMMLDLPGCAKCDTNIDLNHSSNIINIDTKRTIDGVTVKINRTLGVPKAADTKNIKATLEDGVLLIKIPKLFPELNKHTKIDII